MYIKKFKRNVDQISKNITEKIFDWLPPFKITMKMY